MASRSEILFGKGKNRALINTLIVLGIVVLLAAQFLTPGFVINVQNKSTHSLLVTVDNSSNRRDNSAFGREQEQLIMPGSIITFRRYRVCFQCGRIDYSVGITIAGAGTTWSYPDVLMPSGLKYGSFGVFAREIQLRVRETGAIDLLSPDGTGPVAHTFPVKIKN